MLTFKRFRRRVSISHNHGALLVHIARHNDRALYISMLLGFTVFFLMACYIFARPLFRRPVPTGLLTVIPVFAFVLLWYLLGLRTTVWRAFGVEEIVVDRGILCWNRTALFWKRKLEVSTKDITDVKAITPWHALSNRVEFTAAGRRHSIGDMLLRDETTEVARALSRAINAAG